MIHRRAFVTATLAALVAPARSAAQQPRKTARVGWLQPSQPPSGGYANFRRAMQELGYREGENVRFEERWAHGRFDRLPGLARELVQLNVDIIVAVGTGSVRAAKEATATIPIVMGSGDDPVKAGFVNSLSRPGGNVTGMSILAPEVSAKRLDVLKQVLPGVTRVGVLGYRANPGTAEQIAAIEAVAPALKLTIALGYVERPGGYAEPFARFASERVGAVRQPGPLPPNSPVRRPDPQGREAGRPASGATHEIRARHQSHDRPRPWHQHRAGRAGPGRPHRRVS